jgi:hypothetical protein
MIDLASPLCQTLKWIYQASPLEMLKRAIASLEYPYLYISIIIEQVKLAIAVEPTKVYITF